MKTEPIIPARLALDEHGTAWSPEYQDIYHPQAGALVQARHVFLAGNELPQRWQGRDRFVVLETGFGLGNNFLATWQAWRDDPARCERLCFISVEQHPFARADLAAAHANTELPDLARQLHDAWPPLTPNLHSLVFEEGRVELLLALGDVQTWLPEIVAQVDAFYLDGFAPASNPRMWDERVCKALGRLAAPGATLATWSARHATRRHLTTAGFEVRLGDGTGGKKQITLAHFAPHFAPRFQPRRASSRQAVSGDAQERHAVIVGGGLAGCALAGALAAQGWHSTLIDRHEGIAAEASGNPAGLFHGIFNAQDGTHARFNRAASLVAARTVREAIARSGVAGDCAGLLRLETTLDVDAMRAALLRSGLPADYVQVLDAAEASAAAGIALAHPAWSYPAAGWVDPAGLARSHLERAGGRVTRLMNRRVHAIERSASRWRVLDADGRLITEASTLVLANAAAAMALLPRSENFDWPVESIRGQLSIAPAARIGALPRLPIAGSGYLLPQIGGDAVFGATAQPGAMDAAVRDADHASNLAQLERLLHRDFGADTQGLRGRTGWRFSSRDRLPIIGAIPAFSDTKSASPCEALQRHSPRLDQPRFIEREPGLHAFIGLGSRGITWSALGARLLAASISGSPSPVEASLLDAVDPARFMSRAARKLQTAPDAGTTEDA